MERRLGFVLVAAVVAGAALAARGGYSAPSAASSSSRPEVLSRKTYTKPADAQLRKSLTPLQYDVTQKAVTEPPFQNAFWNNHDAGLYVDVATGEPVFASTDKFDSGTGWPSFTRPVEKGRVQDKPDDSHGMSRTEVRSRAGDSHLGHVFPDGPAPTGLRYCINSASLRFVPAAKLAAEGYGEYLPLFGMSQPVSVKMVSTSNLETAYLAGGCFWGMEEILRKIPGVVATEAGYTGGKTPRPDYGQVHTGTTGHAESVKVVFDPKKLSYADLLDKWFFRMHDPTTPNRQGNDVGTQYRSAIFTTSPEQKKIAQEAKVRAAARWKRPVVTEIADAGPFTRAEEYHQKYLEKNPGGYTCHYLRD
jgi:peptide methionine sulfoxide reductase msrA/msrB